MDLIAAKLLSAGGRAQESLPRQIHRGAQKGISKWQAEVPWQSETTGQPEGFCRAHPPDLPQRVGRILQTALRWRRTCAAISRRLHAPGGNLKPPASHH